MNCLSKFDSHKNTKKNAVEVLNSKKNERHGINDCYLRFSHDCKNISITDKELADKKNDTIQNNHQFHKKQKPIDSLSGLSYISKRKYQFIQENFFRTYSIFCLISSVHKLPILPSCV